MVDTTLVLWGQTIAYTSYAIVILLLMGWFGYNISKPGKAGLVKPAIFYTFVGFLTVLGVSLHIVTYNTIPWTAIDLNRSDIQADQTFYITVENHEFTLPSEKLKIKVGETVVFDVTSNDLTYGFGLFRKDNSMLLQMQVVPGHRNDIMWEFLQPGIYTIRSTEYSGPKGAQMILNDVVEVSN